MFRLALSLGKTVAEVESSMGSAELSEWQEYYALEPFGAWRDNWHSAQIAALLFNTNRGKQQPVKSSDFMFIDAQTARDTQDQETLAFLSSKSKKGK